MLRSWIYHSFIYFVLYLDICIALYSFNYLFCPLSRAMHRTMDTTVKGQGPVENNSTVYAIYYVTFVVVFSFFFLNIFVALIILTFQDLGEKEISNCELDRNQVVIDCMNTIILAFFVVVFFNPKGNNSHKSILLSV